MAKQIARADTILIPTPTPTDPQKKHLFVVMCEPTKARPSEVLLVMIATFRPGKDETCILQKGDHPFIKHDSYVVYRSARQMQVNHLLKGMEDKRQTQRYTKKAPVSEEVFQRILGGFYSLKRIPNFVRPYLDMRVEHY